jgi:hypothetical protein
MLGGPVGEAESLNRQRWQTNPEIFDVANSLAEAQAFSHQGRREVLRSACLQCFARSGLVRDGSNPRPAMRVRKEPLDCGSKSAALDAPILVFFKVQSLLQEIASRIGAAV